MRFYFNIFYIIILQILISCNSNKSNLITINIERELGESGSSIYSSEIFSDITYVQLQTNDDIIIGNNPDITIVDNLIIVKDGDNCYLFNKLDGTFIRTIGAKGRGPNEFRSTRGGIVNPINNRIFLLGWQGKLLEYDFDGRFHQEISIPEYSDSFINPSIPINYTFFDKDIIAYFNNPVGTDDKLLMVFTVTGELVSIHNNNNIFPDKTFTIRPQESQFYHHGNQLFFKEIYNDTIYRVTNDQLFAHKVLYTGNYLLPYESKWWGIQSDLSQFVSIYNLDETTSHLFFKFYYNNKSFLGCFDKTTEKLSVSDGDSGIVDDIQNFIPFIPLKAINDNEVMGYTDAWKIEQWFKDNPEKADQLPPHLKKFESLSESDNPVLIIARLKVID
jgi:hypothetical protein